MPRKPAPPVDPAPGREPRPEGDLNPSVSAGSAVAAVADRDRTPVVDPAAVTPLSAEGAHELGVQAGVVLAYRHVALSARMSELLHIQQIRDSGEYERMGYTWGAYCDRVLGRSKGSVADDLASLRALGAERMQLAELLRIPRDDLRVLRSLPADSLPRVLPSGEIELGDGQVVPFDAEHRDKIAETLAGLIEAERTDRKAAEAARTALEEKVADLHTTVRKRDEQIEIGTRELETRDERIAELEFERGATDAPSLVRRIALLGHHLGNVLVQVEDTTPDRQTILRACRPLQATLDALLRYGAGIASPEDTEAAIAGSGLDFAAAEAVARQHDAEDSPLA